MVSTQKNESSPLLDSHREAGANNRRKFLHQSIAFLLLFAIENTLLAVGGSTIWTRKAAGHIVAGVVWSLVTIQTIFFLLCFQGFLIWKRGDLPIPEDDVTDNCKYCPSGRARFVSANNDDGNRNIEYFVWGSDRDDAIVTVLCHGSNTTGKYFNQVSYPDKVMKEMNVRVISPSYPGHGGSDSQPHRRIREWPKDDLEPILTKERVDKFIVQGSSYGTAHAMATAAYFVDRCLAVGLNVPYLPEPICREFGYHTDADYILRESQLTQPWILLPVLSLLSMFMGVLPMALTAIPEGKEALKQNMTIIDALKRDCKRSFARGVIGQVNEMLNAETTQHWVDPRTDISTTVVSVWYAEDDSLCPPDHGKWLADIFQARQGIQTNVRVEKKGLGHLTYFGEEDAKNGLQTKVLLEMLNR